MAGEGTMASIEDSELGTAAADAGAVQLHDAAGLALDADEGERPYQSRTTLMEVGACCCSSCCRMHVLK